MEQPPLRLGVRRVVQGHLTRAHPVYHERELVMQRILMLSLVLAVSLVLGVSSFTLFAPPTAASEPFPACNRVDPTNRQLVTQGRQLFSDAHVFSQKQPFRACITCHGGPALTDNENHTIAPTGSAAVTFPRSTPSLLQNLDQTAPYTWDGRAACLQL